jgi:sigma-B regulation protein RsbU (phosphoserine phosphatase)
MESSVFERIRGSLQETRHSLSQWLQVAPRRKQEICLGPASESNIQAHLIVLDTAIAKTIDHTLGICEVCHGYVDPELLEMDYTACICLDHYSGEERRQLEADLELSQKVQKALMPQHLPNIPGLELAVFSRPAQIVGGDYFDFFQWGDGSYGLTIADVAGHGMSASMLMASVQTALRTLAPLTPSPAEMLRHLNRFFYHNVHLTTFVTLFLARFDPARRTLTYVNAGHNPPLLYHRQANGNDPIIWLQPTAAAIGLVEEFQVATKIVTLAQGDILLLYTDGVTEAMNAGEEQFGSNRLAELVQKGAGSSAKALIQSLRRELQEFIDGQPLVDDATIVMGKMGAEV